MKGLLASAAAACAVALLLAGAASAKPPERFTDSLRTPALPRAARSTTYGKVD